MPSSGKLIEHAMNDTAYQFLSGALIMGYLVLGLFFLKFWKRTRDSLFIMFAWAFWLLAANGILFFISGGLDVDAGWTYLLRLIAFVLIIVAIVRKNMERTKG
jgi:peptidoglycan/LPS O-acetylase OafA/YrhL